jgi:hypothetical protein
MPAGRGTAAAIALGALAGLARVAAAVVGVVAVVAVVAVAGAVAVAATGCAGTTDADDTSAPLVAQHEDVSLAACGAVVSYRAPSADREGTLALERRTWSVLPGAKIDGADLLVAGADVCVRADLDSERRILACAVSAAPEEDPWAEAGLN